MNPTATAAKTTLQRALANPIMNPKTPVTMPTLAERKQQELEQEVCRIYEDVVATVPEMSWHQRAVQVAAKTGLSPEGIKKLLERNGITNPKKRASNESK